MAAASIESRVTELRFLDGIEKVEHVPYPAGDQFWVRFNQPLDFGKIGEIVKKHGYRIVRFASLPSKLPRGLAEMLWDGITHVIVKNISGWAIFTSSLGFEPDGIAKIGVDLHGPYELFMAMNEEGVQVLYEYLGLKYVPPPPPPAPPKPAAPVKPAAPAAARPTPPAGPPQPAVAQPPRLASPPPSGQPQQPVTTPAATKPLPPAASQLAAPAASPMGPSAGSTSAQAGPVTKKTQSQADSTNPQAKNENSAQNSSQAG